MAPVSLTAFQPVLTWEGLLMGTVCNESGCVNVALRSHLQVGANGELMASYWDPADVERSEAVLSTNPCDGQALARILRAMAAVALAPSQP